MKKKILTLCLTFLLSIPLICKHISVKASENAWTSTGIEAVNRKGEKINDTIGDGCFISIVDFLKTPENVLKFLNLHEGQEYVTSSISADTVFIKAYFEDYINVYSYYDTENYGSYFIYFESKNQLNNFLVNNKYINPGETYEDPIDGYSTSEYTVAGKDPATCLDDLLNSELKYEFVDPRNLPTMIYKDNGISNYKSDCWYKIVSGFDYGIVNGRWNYRQPNVDSEEGEVSKTVIEDSVGTFQKVSGNTYQYTYTELKWNEEFGYYCYNQAEVKTITIDKEKMPSIAFDSNGYLKDDYYSVNNNIWYKAYVKDVTKEIEINCYVKSVYPFLQDLTKYDVPTKRHSWKYFEVYFNFDLNNGLIDCLYELSYNLKLYYKVFFKTYYVDDFCCTLTFDQKIISSDVPENWLNALIWNVGSSEKNVIESGDFSFEVDGKAKNYSWKTIFIDDKYSAYDANPGGINKNKYVCLLNWNNNARNHPTYFNELYFSSTDEENQMKASAVFSYQGILYSFENVNVTIDNSIDVEDDMFSKILKWLKELFSKLINWFQNSTFGKVLKWILIVVFSLLTIYIIYAIKKSKSLKNKKSTK